MQYKLESTKQYDKWFLKIKDHLSKIRILARLNRVENGNFGDCKSISKNLSELHFFFGAGFRIYYTIINNTIVLLLLGGDKPSQEKDIKKAEELLSKMEE